MNAARTTAPEPVNQAPGPVLRVTEQAARRVLALMDEEGLGNRFLRIFVSGGGCAGFRYGFGFEERAAEDDTRIEVGALTVLVDPISLPYLVGAEIDYENDAMGERFLVHNPNATTSCGCGSSFSA